MNDLPLDWSAQLQSAYPKRSGPCGWTSVRLMLALRSALQQSTWEQIIDGCKRYKRYCEQSGKEGTDFVQNPLRFIADGCYAEAFEYKAPETKEQKERRELAERDRERINKTLEVGRRLIPPVLPLPGDTAASYETRVRMAADNHKDSGKPASLNRGMAELVNQLRMPK